jgi:predicted DNA-binding transcriptional regulator AlpA
MDGKRWINPGELAEMFGIAKSTQAKMRSDKTIPYSKIGGFIYYSVEKIEAWLEAHSIEPKGAAS